MLVIHSIGSFGNPVSNDPLGIASGTQLVDMEKARLSGVRVKDAKEYTFQGNDTPLIYTLDRSRHLKATNPRDRIFALQGLVEEIHSPEFQSLVDYSLSVEQVYINFAKYELLHRKDLQILSSATVVSNLSLPSWVPDWTYTPSEGRPITSELEMNWGLVRAGGLDYGGPEIRISSDEKTLQVQGAIFTKPLLISEIYQTPRSNDFGERAYDLKSTFIRQIYEISCAGPDPYPNGEPRIEAFLRALTHNCMDWCHHIKGAITITCNDGMHVLDKYRLFGIPSVTEHSAGMAEFEKAMEMNRRFCLMENGYFGWVPQATEMKDCIAMFKGAKIMFVLKAVGNGQFRLVGECYLHGIKSQEGTSLTEIAIV